MGKSIAGWYGVRLVDKVGDGDDGRAWTDPLMVICVPIPHLGSSEEQTDAAATTGRLKEEMQTDRCGFFLRVEGLRRCCGPAVYHGNCMDLRGTEVQRHYSSYQGQKRSDALHAPAAIQRGAAAVQ